MHLLWSYNIRNKALQRNEWEVRDYNEKLYQ